MSLYRGCASAVFALTWSLAACHGQSPAPASDPLAARLARQMEGLEQWGFSGAVLVARDDRILLESGYGYADTAQHAAIDAATIFDLGSLAKQYTAAAILLLQDRGRLSVQDTLGAFFPAVPADKCDITLHHLLTHTSGIRREVGQDWEVTDRATFERRVLDSDLLFLPGEGFSYSNAGFAMLAAVIERVSGTPFHLFMEREIFASAGLHHTGFIGRSPDPSHTAHAASGTTAGQNPADWEHTWNHRGSGGLLSTVGDFYRWRRTLMDGGVISRDAVAAMHTAYANGYGYGVQVTDGEFGLAYHHTGLWYSFTSRFSEYPHDSVLVIAVSNGRDGPFQPANVAARDLTDEIFGRPGTPPPALALRARPPAALEGTYRTEAGGAVRVAVEDDHLRLDGTGQDVFTALFSDGTPAPDVLTKIRVRTVAILMGIGASVFDTLEVAAPRERYERYKRLLPPIWAEREDSLGPLERVDFIGTVDRGSALDAFASLRFARGSEGVALTWSRAGVLLALSNENPTMDGGLLTFRQTVDGSFAAYHFETRTVVRLRLSGDRLVVVNDDGTPRLEARKQPSP